MNTAYVNLWGERVGAVAWDDESGFASFEYEPGFKYKQWDISPLQMSVRSEKRVFNFPALRKRNDPDLDTFKGLPGLLADSLPDRYGNDLINLWLTSQGRPLNSMNPVEMLCFIGTRAMGALEFEPVTLKESKKPFSVEIENLVELSRQILSQKEAFSTNLTPNEEKAILEIIKIGTSAGGARPKAVIAYNEKTGEVKSGQTNAPEGFEHWLIKLDGVSEIQMGSSKGYGRVEMAYYNMAIACGIEMMPSMLLEENGRAHFMITQRISHSD
jgi:serine/threonine-protein kinase HipA